MSILIITGMIHMGLLMATMLFPDCRPSAAAREPYPAAISSQAVWSSIESHLTAIAVNGHEIPATPTPRVSVGDVITFRVLTKSIYSGVLRGVLGGASWGRGLVFQGSLSGNHDRLRYDAEVYEIKSEIFAIQGRPAGKADSRNHFRETDAYYTFDLMVVSCQDLFVEVYTDELYSCRPKKKYYLRPQIITPEIQYAIDVDLQNILSGRAGRVSISVHNVGEGAAVDLALDSNLHRFPATVAGISPGFTYNTETGRFVAESALDSGRQLVLSFDLRMDMEGGVDRPEAVLRFRPDYADTCGLRFYAPETALNLRFEESSTQETILHGAELALRVSPECLRLEPGEPMEWTLYVTNRGDTAAADVMVQNILGDHLVLHQNGVRENGVTLLNVEKNTPTPGRNCLTWSLGDIAPSRTVKVLLTASSRETPDHPWMTASENLVRLASDCVEKECLYQEKAAPCFIWPEKCIDGDIFGGPGRVRGFFSLTHMYKSNIYRSDRFKKASLATYLTPGVWVAVPAVQSRPVEISASIASPGGFAVRPFYTRSDRLYQAYLMYSPQFQFYHNQNDDNFVSHQLDGLFRYSSRNRLTFQVVDQFKRSHDSFSSRRLSISDKYISNLLSTMTTFDPTHKLRLRLDYTNYFLKYRDAGNNMADRMDNAWSIYGFFHLTPKTSLFTEYEFVYINYLRNDLDSTENRYFSGIRWDITKKTKGRIKVGYGKKNYDVSLLSEADTWMAEILVDHDLTAKTRLVANAYRLYEEDLGASVDVRNLSPDRPTHILTNMLGVAVYHDITDRFLFNLDTHCFFDQYEYAASTVAVKARKDQEFAVSPAIRYRYNKWLTVDLTYVYSSRESSQAQLDYTDHTLMLRAAVFQ